MYIIVVDLEYAMHVYMMLSTTPRAITHLCTDNFEEAQVFAHRLVAPPVFDHCDAAARPCH